MCWGMANGVQNQEGLPKNLRRQLAVAVRSVQWSYAIFWSLSTTQQGVLEWCDGYYNGDIKTRKLVQVSELKADKMGLQRSEQLRELYKCLLEGDTDQQAMRPSSALSPDDLTDEEWYYLVCMSFAFNPGEGLPGRALATGQPIWLCEAHSADSKVFSRSLLAKSASIQTVICFPHFGGVIELGVTELVLENPSLIQHVKTSLLEFSKPVCSEKSSSACRDGDDDLECMYAKVGDEKADTMAFENFCSLKEEGQNGIDENALDDFARDSHDDCSNGCEHDDLMDDDFINSSDCISQVLMNHERPISRSQLREVQERNYMKLSSLDLGLEDHLHYRRTLSLVLGNSHQSLNNLYFQCHNYKSSFVIWKKGEASDGHKPEVKQKMLKKVLLNVPLMYGCCLSRHESGRKDWFLKLESDGFYEQHAFPDKKMENEKFLVLRSMVPSISKIDKESILGDTIEYLRELEARVEELESCVDLAEHEARATRQENLEVAEQISDNCENRAEEGQKKPWVYKRKASDIDEADQELSSFLNGDGPVVDMKVSIKEHEVLIEMRCPWRDYLLHDILDAMGNLNLDPQLVQSSTVDGILTVILQSKFKKLQLNRCG
ncbi:hypothetical protein NMG60_11029063 [Bertholletia excelsa]